MQFSTTTLLALLPTLTLAINANYVSPPPEHPTCKTTVYTCKGNLKCCTMDLQGTAMNIAAYCPPGGGNMPAGGCGALFTHCCAKDAERGVTPRGDTYVGCSKPGVSMM